MRNDPLNWNDPSGLHGFYFGVDYDFGAGLVGGVSLLWWVDVRRDPLRLAGPQPVLVLHLGVGLDYSGGGVLGYTRSKDNLLGWGAYAELGGGPFSGNAAVPRGTQPEDILSSFGVQGEIAASPLEVSGSGGVVVGFEANFDADSGVATVNTEAADIQVNGWRVDQVQLNTNSGEISIQSSRDVTGSRIRETRTDRVGGRQ